MDAEIRDFPAIKVCGLVYTGKNERQEIPAMWAELNQRVGEINPPLGDAYGICRVPKDIPEGQFTYLAGFEVKDPGTVPYGMTVWDVPACQVASFKHVGSLAFLMETYRKIFSQWLPASPYQLLEPGFDMELYTQEFCADSPDSVMYVLLPIIPKG